VGTFVLFWQEKNAFYKINGVNTGIHTIMPHNILPHILRTNRYYMVPISLYVYYGQYGAYMSTCIVTLYDIHT